MEKFRIAPAGPGRTIVVDEEGAPATLLLAPVPTRVVDRVKVEFVAPFEQEDGTEAFASVGVVVRMDPN
jgi:hypothetical protein